MEYRGFNPCLTSSELSVHPARYHCIKEIIGAIIMMNLRLTGRNLFHVKYIKLSYRIRGMVARIHTKMVAIIIVLIMRNRFINTRLYPVIKIMVRRLIIRILAYSAIKISANLLLLYSTLNPDTNSDSPSAKSNGVRLVSARFVIIHIIARGLVISMIQEIMFIDIIDISI